MARRTATAQAQGPLHLELLQQMACIQHLEIRMGETSDFDTWRQWEGLDDLMG